MAVYGYYGDVSWWPLQMIYDTHYYNVDIIPEDRYGKHGTQFTRSVEGQRLFFLFHSQMNW